MTTVAVVGTGRMGGAMARALAGSDLDLALYNARILRESLEATEAAETMPYSESANDDEELPAAAETFRPSPATRRRKWLRIVATAALVGAAVGGPLLAVSGRLSPIILGIAIGAAVGILVNGLRLRTGMELTIAPVGVTYRTRMFTLASPWEGVAGLVQLGASPATVAIQLAGSSVVHEARFPLGAPWRRQPYGFDRTIPLEPFLGGPGGTRLTDLLRATHPTLFDTAPTLDVPAPVEPRWRIVGLVVGLLPAPLLGAAFLVALATSAGTVAVAIDALVFVALVAGEAWLLWRWQPGGGERVVDYIGRSLVAPRSGERRAKVVRPLGTTYGWLVVGLAFGYVLGQYAYRPATAGQAESLPPVATWATFTSPDGQFAVSFPGQPKFSSQPHATANSTTLVQTYTWSPDANAALAASSASYPSGSLSALDPIALLDSAENGVLANDGGTLLASRNLSMCGGVGREFVDRTRGSTSTVRLCIVGDRLFSEIAGGVDAAGTQAFFDSFRLLAVAPATASPPPTAALASPSPTTCPTAAAAGLQHQAPEIEAVLPATVAGHALARWSVRGECWLELAYNTQTDIAAFLAAFTTAANPNPNDPAQLVYGVDGRSNTQTDPPYFVFAALRPQNSDEASAAMYLLAGLATYQDPSTAGDLTRYKQETIAGKKVYVGTLAMLAQSVHQRGKPYLYQTDQYTILVITDNDAWAADAIRQLP
jgi:hypothetical protein